MDENWALICAIISLNVAMAVLVLDFFELLSHSRDRKIVEGALTFIATAVCTANVSIVSDPSNGIAVDVNGSVFFGNLYYSTWASFFLAVVLSVSFISSVTKEGQGDDSGNGNNLNQNVLTELMESSPRLRSWFCLMVSSLVVMGASSSIYENQCIHSKENNHIQRPAVYCSRTVMGISFGCISSAISLVIIALKISLGFLSFLFHIEFGCGLVLFFMSAFAATFITSDLGPGAPMGNLYYFTWASFGISFIIASTCYEEYQSMISGYDDDADMEEIFDDNAHHERNDVDQNAKISSTYDLNNSMPHPNQDLLKIPSSPHNTSNVASFDDIPIEDNHCDNE